MKLTIAGEDQMPAGNAEREEVLRLRDSNPAMMNRLFSTHFGLNPYDRYMGSFPYADRETGRPRVAWVLCMRSPYTRDAIVACLRTAIHEAGLGDIAVNKRDDEGTPETAYRATVEIVAMGPSITDTLVGEKRVEAALNALATWLSPE